jgi:hypothetical protein
MADEPKELPNVLDEILKGNVKIKEPSEVEREGDAIFRKITGVDFEVVRAKYDADAGKMLNQMLTDLQQVLGGAVCVFAALNRVLLSDEVKELFKDEPSSLIRERAKLNGVTRDFTAVYVNVQKQFFK